MHEYPILIFAALLIFVYGLFSRLSERLPVSAAMVFVSVGILAGPLGLNLMEMGITSTAVRVIVELTLVLVLFIDASTIDLRSLIREKGLPFRLLAFGLPLTMVFGIALAVPIFGDMNVWSIALLALILSPTDAALGQPVVTSPRVPDRIKQAINVESGLNDGMALPPSWPAWRCSPPRRPKRRASPTGSASPSSSSSSDRFWAPWWGGSAANWSRRHPTSGG
ncbi:MAG TPA: cation:proton antiporter [Syntrophales bacterium]|nr:cation:proton antiporter [Syntrophales bacterium]